MSLPGRTKKQRGLALLVVVIALVLVALAWIANGLANRKSGAEEKATSIALAKAKEALIAYAVRYSETHPDNVPGYLPCPDAGAVEGTSPTVNCGNQNVSSLRKLPWKTLGIEPLRDSSGECLWYAVSGTYKNAPKTALMNWDNNGLIEIVTEDGTTLLAGSKSENRAAAVVIAPGPAIGAQSHTKVANAPECGGNYVASNYLDSRAGVNNAVVSTVANALSRFVAGSKSPDFNDTIIYITPEEIFEQIQKRIDFKTRIESLTKSIAECVGKYGQSNGAPIVRADNRLPWPAFVNLTSFISDTSYNDNAAGSLKSGRLPFVVDTSKIATTNQMSGTHLLSNGNFLCPLWSTDDDAWYTNWKDHFFYVLAGSFAPTAPHPTVFPCPTCITVNGVGSYAAVVVFANQKTAGQSRNTIVEKRLISNYLEGRNSSTYPNTAGNANLEKSASVNDMLYCVTFDPVTHVSTVASCP